MTVSSTASVRSSAKGFTLVELLVVIGIIALLISILLPSLNKARDAANTVACLSNQRQLAMLLITYTTENKGSFPYGTECTDGTPGIHNAGTPAQHTTREHLTFREYVIERGGNNARRCVSSGSRHWNGLTNTLTAGGWSAGWGGMGDEIEQDAWILPNARLSPRDDHWQQNAWTGVEEYRNISKISKFKRPHNIMATIDAFNKTQIVTDPVYGPNFVTPDENGDNLGNFGYPPERLRFRHKKLSAINLSFLDGHAETWDFSTLRREPTAWGATTGYERTLLTENMRFFPYGWENIGY